MTNEQIRLEEARERKAPWNSRFGLEQNDDQASRLSSLWSVFGMLGF